MEYNCPGCGKAFEITESGVYKCNNCGGLFQFVAEEAKQEIAIPAERLVSSMCPMCKGVIPHGAKKCQHCGSWIGEKPPSIGIYILLWLFTPTAVLGIPFVYTKQGYWAAMTALMALVGIYFLVRDDGSIVFLFIYYLIAFISGIRHIAQLQR